MYSRFKHPSSIFGLIRPSRGEKDLLYRLEPGNTGSEPGHYRNMKLFGITN